VCAEKLEEQLSRIFKIASQWNALLLLDEADVFLERRSPSDTSRNGLVTVFLRKLEYFEGILFLTTNRVSEFDDAILSRIHIMLKYNSLSKDERREIWKHFLEKAHTYQGAAEISDQEFGRMVNSQLNGRQVSLWNNLP
jgi:SpoVK/Ycf46/Vps4 family AAA+-type ATPase